MDGVLMARIRTIKPEFFTSEDIVSLSPLARLLYIALWCEADKEGRMAWKPVTFKLRYMPGDNCDINALCSEILERGLIKLYGNGLAYIPSFAAHQHINPRESASQLPAPQDDSRVGTRQPRVGTGANLDVHPQVGREGKGREGEGTRVDDDASGSGEPPPDLDPEKQNPDPRQATAVTMAGAVCVALKSIGMMPVNPSHPGLRALLDSGADIGTFVEIGRECVKNKKPFAYLLAAVKGRMADSAAMADAEVSKTQPHVGILPGAI